MKNIIYKQYISKYFRSYIHLVQDLPCKRDQKNISDSPDPISMLGNPYLTIIILKRVEAKIRQRSGVGVGK